MLKWKNQHLVIEWKGFLHLSKPAIKEMIWWIENIKSWDSQAIIIKTPQQTVTTDISGLKWGVWMENQEMQGFWLITEQKYSNNTGTTLQN